MHSRILLFPTLTEALTKKIRFRGTEYKFFYTEQDGKRCELSAVPIEAGASVECIRDENGRWDQDRHDIGFRRNYCLRSFQGLFSTKGIACKTAKLGLAVVWTSSDSKQRGVIPVCTFSEKDRIVEAEVEKLFDVAQLRGEVSLSTVIYLAEKGEPTEREHHLANIPGYILGELDELTIKIDGNGSTFPVFEVEEPGQPLWYVKCDWIDPCADSFSDSVSINLNTVHKNYKFIDRAQQTFNSQLLIEVMAGAIAVIIEKLRGDVPSWEQIMNNENLENGSVGQAVYYFHETLGWDLSTPETVSLSVRSFFEQRM